MSRLEELENFAQAFLETVAAQDIVNNTYEGFHLQRLTSMAASAMLGYDVGDVTDIDQLVLTVDAIKEHLGEQ
ncbi:hypothetical protein [Acinetobacter sp.]|uniref:hypothetical protein n=1 Tax=Acinetobacter sp. TaxID=472 RepID=UPI00388EF913